MSDKITAGDLARILSDAAIFASRDDTLPMINSVHIESSGEHVIAVATDRFTMGVSKADYLDGKGDTFDFQLRLPQVRILISIAKSCREAFSHVEIAPSGDGATFSFSSGEVVTLPGLSVNFIDWRKIVTATDDGEATSFFGLNPQYVARFARVGGADAKMKVKVGSPKRPTRVQIGDQFVGLVMPVHLPDDAAWTPPAWLEKPAPATKKRAPRKPRTKKTA